MNMRLQVVSPETQRAIQLGFLSVPLLPHHQHCNSPFWMGCGIRPQLRLKQACIGNCLGTNRPDLHWPSIHHLRSGHEHLAFHLRTSTPLNMTSSCPFLNPASRICTFQIPRNPSRWMKMYYYVWPLLVYYHIPLQTFFDFNAIFISLQCVSLFACHLEL